MKLSTADESMFNKLAAMAASVRSEAARARGRGQMALAAHLDALAAQIAITQAAALDAAGKRVGQ